jgi:hypothetical protein
MAEWAGYSVARLNEDHDKLHAALCKWLGIASHAMLDAAGLPHDARLAEVEEVAVLSVQRLIAHHNAKVP